MISFKHRHFKKEMILMLVRWYVAYALSYRDIEELTSERGLKVDREPMGADWIDLAGLWPASFYRPSIITLTPYQESIKMLQHKLHCPRD